MKKRISYFNYLLFYFISLILFVGCDMDNKKQLVSEYSYVVRLSAPKEYNLLFGGHDSYLYLTELNEKSGSIVDHKVTSFPTLGDFKGGFWRQGSKVTSGSNKAEFPSGIFLRWYSLFEKQGWVARYDFNPEFMTQIKQHCFMNVIRGYQDCLTAKKNIFSFNIYAMPSGLAYVYISGAGETYFLGEIQAEPTDINFEIYKKTLGSKLNETGEEVFNRRLSYQTEEFQEAYHNGALSFSTERWERRMNRYSWEVVGNSWYQVKGPYNGVYTNAEMYNIYNDGKNTFHGSHAPPNHLTVYLEGTELSPNPGRVERIRFKFNDEEIMEAFEVMKSVNPEAKMTIEIDMDVNFKSHRIILANGNKAIRLKPTMFYIEDIPPLI